MLPVSWFTDDASPFAALLRRELLARLRRKSTYALVLLTVGACFFALSTQWEDLGRTAGGSETFLVFYFLVLTCVASLILPVAAATTLCIERQRGILDLLQVTLLRPGDILAAKFLSALSVYLLVAASTFPLVGVVFFSVGIEWGQFLAAAALLLPLASACTSIGLSASVRCERPVTAMVSAFLASTVFAWFGYACLLAVQLHGAKNFFAYPGYPTTDAVHALSSALSPGCALTFAARGALDLESYLFVFVYALMVSGACCLKTHEVLRRPPKPRVLARRSTAPAPDSHAWRPPFPVYLFGAHHPRRPISDRLNPVFIKEVYTGPLHGGTAWMRMVYAMGLLFFVVSFMIHDDARSAFFDLRLGWVFFAETILIVMALPPIVANSLAHEHELQYIDLLRGTLMRPGNIIRGKLYAAFFCVAPFILAAVLGMTPVYAALIRWRLWSSLALCAVGFAWMIVSSLLVIAFSLVASVLCRRTSTAIVAAYVLNVVLLAGVPLLKLQYFDLMPLWIQHFFPTEARALVFISLPSPLAGQVFNLVEWSRNGPFVNGYMGANIGASLIMSMCLPIMAMNLFKDWRLRDK